ncbi:MAG: NTP transferase domain-containing protein [Thermodesulfobacteriota bacterium]
MENLAVIILAAGKGTRMNSDQAKVIHEVAGQPMILYVVDAATRIAGSEIIVVVGTQGEAVRSVVSARDSRVRFAWQENQLGTGHAVLSALPVLSDHIKQVVILCGDVPLIQADTLNAFIEAHCNSGHDITVLAAYMQNPKGYGRLITENGHVRRIVEESDANSDEKRICHINTGIYCVNRNLLENALSQINSDNAQNEMYLTDIVGIAAQNNTRIGMFTCSDNTEMLGINTPADLETVAAIISSDEKS